MAVGGSGHDRKNVETRQGAVTGPPTVFGSSAFGRVLVDRPLVAIDIGARRGFVEDLLPIAAAVDAVGFEPDEGECERLNRVARCDSGPWRGLRFLPTALAAQGGRRELYVTGARGTSSMLVACPGVGARYMRGHYFTVERTAKVDVLALDDALSCFRIGSPDYMKVDVEGMEKEVFRRWCGRTHAGAGGTYGGSLSAGSKRTTTLS